VCIFARTEHGTRVRSYTRKREGFTPLHA